MSRLVFCIGLLGLALPIFGTPTDIVIRAKAKDAKFIGSSIGGARVVVADLSTGQILAQGYTAGGTGNTQRIMKDPWERGVPLSDQATAKFVAKLDLAAPTLIHITVHAPVRQRQAAITGTIELWAIPGKHILGDGVVVEIPGFVVDVLAPRTHQFVSASALAGKPLAIRANVVMMCGCPIGPGGLWDANQMEVAALLEIDGQTHGQVILKAIGDNLFEGQWPLKTKGNHQLTIYAYNPSTGNTGVDIVNFVVGK